MVRYHLKCCVIVNALIECKIIFFKVVRQSLKVFYLVTTPQICFSPAAAGSVTVLPMLQLLHILDHKILVCSSAMLWW